MWRELIRHRPTSGPVHRSEGGAQLSKRGRGVREVAGRDVLVVVAHEALALVRGAASVASTARIRYLGAGKWTKGTAETHQMAP